jgi:hypothetical protein
LTYFLFLYFFRQLSLACGYDYDYDNDVEGKEDLKKVKELLSQYPSLLNESLDGHYSSYSCFYEELRFCC